MKNHGFSLIELIVVIGIMGIIMSIAAINFSQWQIKNNIERQANEMYMEIAEARQLALNTKQARTIRFSANSLVFRRYTTDTDLESGEGVVVKTKALQYTITRNSWVAPSDNPNITDADILFTTRGIMDQPTPKAICIYSAVNPALDAIVIVESRVAAGKIKVRGEHVVQLKSISNNTGFTLVELLVALVITMVGLLGLLSAINLSISTNLGNALRFQATGIAEDVLNKAKQQPFSNTSSWTRTTGTPPLDDYYLYGAKKNYSVTRTITSFTDTKRITVGVSWLYRNQRLEHTVSTIMGKSYGE